MGFQQTSFFPQTSPTHPLEHEMPRERRRHRPPLVEPTVSADEIEDWAHRLSQCAAEADDYEAWNLESDLLDIRDEMILAIQGSAR